MGGPRGHSPPLPAGQALARRPFLPVGPRVRANDAAARAHHARPERGAQHFGYHGDMPQSRYRGPPMTLANMRAQGVRFAMGRP